MVLAKLDIPIGGMPSQVEVMDIDIDHLILDEENPRLGFWSDNIARGLDELHQEDLEYALKSVSYDEYNRLKKSIETNEGIMTEIWVKSLGDGHYKIIDGNTRVIIYRDLRKKYPNKDAYKKIRAKILPKEISDDNEEVIKLMSHMRGVNDWETYARARNLFILWDQRGFTEERLIDLTKLSLAQIRQWREAYRNMTEQFLPKYCQIPNALSKFSYFVEYENNKIKSGMERNGLSIKDFCDWVGQEEINRAQDVRDLVKIFDNDNIVRILKEEGFQSAKYELSKYIPAYSSRLFDHIEKCIIGLKEMTREDEESILNNESPKKKEKILELYNELEKFKKMIDLFDDSS